MQLFLENQWLTAYDQCKKTSPTVPIGPILSGFWKQNLPLEVIAGENSEVHTYEWDYIKVHCTQTYD